MSGIKADDEEGLGRCVKLTVTNNTDEIARNVEITATGDFEIVDEYGDKDKTQLEMKLSCWSPRLRHERDHRLPDAGRERGRAARRDRGRHGGFLHARKR